MIKSFVKGMVIGIANIVPGVSGGTMMVSMGIYDKLIHCITHLFSEFKQNVLFLLPIALGMVAAIAGSSFGLSYLFSSFPIQTNLLFVGLILGGLPAIWKKVKGRGIKAGHGAVGILFFVLVVGLAAMGETEGAAADLTFSAASVVKLVLVGVIASATMVIPGVSGSMVLMLMGLTWRGFSQAAAFWFPLASVWWRVFLGLQRLWRLSLRDFLCMPIGPSLG